MAKKPIKSEPKLIELLFPVGGVDLSGEFGRQRPRTTPIGENVRAFDTLAGSARGGSRPGLVRYIDEAVIADAAIQHMNVVVSTSGEALGWAGQPVDFDIFGFDFGPALAGGSGGTPGGGGYYPSDSFQKNRIWYLTLESSGLVWPADGNDVEITATLRVIADDSPVSGKEIKLRTHPAGKVGHNATGTTDGSGQVVFPVSDLQPEAVRYAAAETSTGIGSNQILDFMWIGDLNPDAALINVTAYAPQVVSLMRPPAGLIELTGFAPTIVSGSEVAYMLTASASSQATTSGTFTYGAASLGLTNGEWGFAPTPSSLDAADLYAFYPLTDAGGSFYHWINDATPDATSATDEADFAAGSHTADLTASGTIGDGTLETVDYSLDQLTRIGPAVGAEELYPGTMDFGTGVFTVSAGDPTTGGMTVGSQAGLYNNIDPANRRKMNNATEPAPHVTAITSTTIEFDLADLGGAGGSVVGYVRFGVWHVQNLWSSFLTASDPGAGPANDNETVTL